MSRVSVDPGACGHRVTIEVEPDPGGRRRGFRLRIETDCPHVQRLGAEVPSLGRMDALTAIPNNPVYCAAGRCLKHAACPVPTAILKALEVAAGLNVAKASTIRFD